MRRVAHGIEVLLRKASVDPGFRDHLLLRRALAAAEIGLELNPAEEQVLSTIPGADLQTMIAKIEVPPVHRKVFMGKTAAAMLAIVVGAGVIAGCSPVVSTGIRPKEESGEDQQQTTGQDDEEQDDQPVRGIRADPVEPREDSGEDR